MIVKRVWVAVSLCACLVVAVPAGAAPRVMTDADLAAVTAGITVGPRRAKEAAATAPETSEVTLDLGGTRVSRRVRSFKEIREKGVVLQALDYSCGAAALASVITYFFQKPTTEQEVIATILVSGQTPQEGLRKYFRRRGFTLLDLKRASQARGLRSTGFSGMTVEDLVEVLRDERLPILVPIRPLGYYHFVVVRGVRGNRIFLADPALGNTTMKVSVFEDAWVEGIGFILTQPDRRAGKGPLLAAALGGNEANKSQTDASPGLSDGETKRQGDDPLPPLLQVRPEGAVPNTLWLMTVVERTPPVLPLRDQTQIFRSADGRGIISFFALPNYNPSVQFGDPAGNFADFSPPRGQSISSNPSTQSQ